MSQAWRAPDKGFVARTVRPCADRDEQSLLCDKTNQPAYETAAAITVNTETHGHWRRVARRVRSQLLELRGNSQLIFGRRLTETTSPVADQHKRLFLSPALDLKPKQHAGRLKQPRHGDPFNDRKTEIEE